MLMCGGKCGTCVWDKAAPYNAFNVVKAGGIIIAGDNIFIFSTSASCTRFLLALLFYNIYFLFLIYFYRHILYLLYISVYKVSLLFSVTFLHFAVHLHHFSRWYLTRFICLTLYNSMSWITLISVHIGIKFNYKRLPFTQLAPENSQMQN